MAIFVLQENFIQVRAFESIENRYFETDWLENNFKFTLNNFVYRNMLNQWPRIKLPKVNNKFLSRQNSFLVEQKTGKKSLI